MLGRNIRYYRLCSGMSQAELSAKVGVGKMAISNYEHDKRVPSMEILKKIAEALGVSTLSFISHCDENLSFEHGAFRKKKSTMGLIKQELVREKIERYFSRFFTLVSILGESVLPKEPKIEAIPFSDLEEAAQNMRTSLGLPAAGPLGNLVNHLENKGFLIYIDNFQQDGFYGIHGTVGGRPYLAIRKGMTPERQRFTIVHELAHMFFDSKDNLHSENEINAIAGAFLLPREDLIRELGPRRTDIRQDLRFIQQEYGMSMAAIAKRAQQVNIISDEVYRNIMIWLSQMGLRMDEHSGLIVEKPNLFKQLICRAVLEDEISMQRAVELSEIPYEQLRALCFGET